MTVVDLPPELAPAQRARVEQLLAEVPLAEPPPPRRGQNLRPPCYVCHRTGGPMGGHHLVHGDDATVVPVHRSCHRKLHPKTKENLMGISDAARHAELEERTLAAQAEAERAGAPSRPAHVIRTTHIGRLIGNAADLARRVDGKAAGTVIGLQTAQRPGNPEAAVEHALCKAIADLRHAADELDAERLSCFGWGQV